MIMSASLAFYSCQKETTSTTANLAGFAFLYDSVGIKESDNSGISVSIIGSSGSTTTGVDGKWSLTNLKVGTYTFTLSKPGYNTVTLAGFQFSGNGQTFGSTSLFPYPTYNIINLSDSTFQGGIKISGTFTGTLPTLLNYHLFFGFNSNVSSNYSTYFIAISEVANQQKTFNQTIYNYNYLYNYPNYLVGDTIYMVAYTDNNPELCYYNYINNNNNYLVYPCLSPTPSNVVKIVVR